MSIEEGLVTHLRADAAVAAIVATRIHPHIIPQGGTLPAIVYQRISSVRDVDMSGPAPMVRVRMQVDCWHTSLSGALTLADTVRAALNGVGIASPRLLGAESVQLVVLESDSTESEIEGDRMEYRVRQDWIIVHLEA